MIKPLTAGEKIARDLCEMDAPIDNIIEVDPVDVARRIDEVVNAHNRLECYSTGITNDIIESFRSVAEKSLAELSTLKAENESLKRDAEQWRAYQKRKQDLLDRGFLRSPLREEAELNPAMAQREQE